jgi:hypothetical protein
MHPLQVKGALPSEFTSRNVPVDLLSNDPCSKSTGFGLEFSCAAANVISPSTKATDTINRRIIHPPQKQDQITPRCS